MDPRARILRRDRQLRRDLVVGQILDDPQLEGSAMVSGQGVEELVRTVQPTLLGRYERPIRRLERAEPLPGTVLQALAPHRLQQDMARDAVQPGGRRAVYLIAERVPHAPRLGKRLRKQIERDLPVMTAAQVITLNPLGVAVIDDAERAGIVDGGRQQRCVARSRVVHAPYMKRHRQNVTGRSAVVAGVPVCPARAAARGTSGAG